MITEEKFPHDMNAQTLFEIVTHIGRMLTSTLDPQEIFQRVTDSIEGYFSPDYWALLLSDRETGKLTFKIVSGVDEHKLKNRTIEPGEGVAGRVFQTGNPLAGVGKGDDSPFSTGADELLGFSTRSVMCVPLLNGKSCPIGVIELINKLSPETEDLNLDDSAEGLPMSQRTATEMGMSILSLIGMLAGIAMEKAALHQNVVDMAMIDALTGLNNRQYFNRAFQSEIERVRRYGQKICVLMIDADGLKTINDTYGHLAGDKLLCGIARILRSSARESDVVARFGGDEFVVLMPMADEDAGRALSQRIHEMIDQSNTDLAIPGITLSVSIGLQEAGPENVQDVLHMADQKLYRCKEVKKGIVKAPSEKRDMPFVWSQYPPADGKDIGDLLGYVH